MERDAWTPEAGNEFGDAYYGVVEGVQLVNYDDGGCGRAIERAIVSCEGRGVRAAAMLGSGRRGGVERRERGEREVRDERGRRVKGARGRGGEREREGSSSTKLRRTRRVSQDGREG